MSGCLGLTSDIGVKAWKAKSISRQTSEAEAPLSQVEPEQRRCNLLIRQPWMEQTARLKPFHCLGSLQTSIHESECRWAERQVLQVLRWESARLHIKDQRERPENQRASPLFNHDYNMFTTFPYRQKHRMLKENTRQNRFTIFIFLLFKKHKV